MTPRQVPHLAALEPNRSIFFGAVLDAVAEHIAVLDESGRIVQTNAAWRTFALDNGGVAERTGVGSDYLAVCDEAQEPGATAAGVGLRALLAGGTEPYTLVYPCHTPGEERWFRMRASRIDSGGTTFIVVQHGDVSALHRAEDQASMRNSLLDQVAASVVGTDTDYRVTHWNRGAERLYGWTLGQALGCNVRRLLVPPAAADACDDALASLDRGVDWAGDMTLRRRDGTTFVADVRDSLVRDDAGTVTGYVGVAVDVTERRRAEQNHRSTQQYIEAVAEHMGQGLMTLDALGRLVYMNAATERMLGWSPEQLQGHALLPIIHGHPAAAPDEPEPPPRAQLGREGETVRVDDDTFVCSDGTRLAVAYTVAPFETVDGVSGSVVVFSDATTTRAERERLAQEVESLKWVARIHDALAHDRLRLHAQPIVELASGRTVQHELLIRMLDEQGELIQPSAFLPAAERHGAIRDIDRWVVTQAAALAAAGHPVELNLSAESIVDPAMADFVDNALSAVGADPRLVVVELTETAILHDPEAGRTFLQRISELGCKVALDDFGTGYGGFSYLKTFPVDYLKIDVEFVRDLPRDVLSQQVVQAVVQLAAGTGKLTVAEGVEDEETRALLRGYGVDFGQGFALGRPGPVAEIISMVAVPRV